MSELPPFPLQSRLDAAGAVMGPSAAGERPRHFGDPAAEFHAAMTKAVVVDRSDRVRIEVTGRSPGPTLSGVLTGSVPDPPATARSTYPVGRSVYSAVLTPKGRLITDLRVYSLPSGEEKLLLDVPRAGAPGLTEHLARYLPPRLARTEDVSGETALITVIGPAGTEWLATALAAQTTGGRQALLEELEGQKDLDLVVVGDLLISRTADVATSAFDIIGPVEAVAGAWDALASLGAGAAGDSVWQILRVEAGRPEFGIDMTADTLPPEAGIQDRAIDHGKGCYTGQEVIVRIRDRGHVNRHLRGLTFGDAPTPAAGTELFTSADARAVGRVTSAVASPRWGQTIGLGYVRRAVEPPAELHLGGPDGPVVQVVDLDSPSWVP